MCSRRGDNNKRTHLATQEVGNGTWHVCMCMVSGGSDWLREQGFKPEKVTQCWLSLDLGDADHRCFWPVVEEKEHTLMKS
ncbi:unnamed protein product [Boreogadus saida]